MNRKIRENNWNALKASIQSENILDSIVLSKHGRLDIQSVTWDDYWSFNDLPENIRQNLRDLRESRRRYFAVLHAKNEMKEYCRAYFVLLSSALNISPQFQDIRKILLQKIVSFETISVHHNESAHQIMLVNNMTNPVYLISRIRYPRVLDDPKYLPLLARTDRESGKAAMYYHYRQFAPGHGNPLRLLVYMPVDKARRFEAFHIYHQLQESLVVKKDARCKERAKLIVDCIIHPILKTENGHKSFPSLFSVADIGGGTGELGKQIFERMFQNEPDQSGKVSWEIVDVDFTNFKRHLQNPKMGHRFHTIQCKRQNMFDWLSNSKTSEKKPFHVALLCRVINNLSDYTILGTTCWYEATRLAGYDMRRADWLSETYLPESALDSQGDTNNLIIMNSTVRVKSGTVFRQLSLSRYFQTIHEVCNLGMPDKLDDSTIFYPLRSFSEESLQTPQGDSILGRLCSLTDYVIIEDIDLDARNLINHLEKHGLSHLAAVDLTRINHLTTSNLLCVAEKTNATYLPGTRIW